MSLNSYAWALILSFSNNTHQVQKHSETALDTQKKEDTESSFPMKMHSIVHHQARSSVKFHTFTDELKKLAPNSHSGGANVVQKPNEISQFLEIQRFASGLKTTCFRTSSWKIQAGFIASGSVFLRLMTNAHQCRRSRFL